MPGFVDPHVHLHSLDDAQKTPMDYILRLWMSHSVTTVREVGSDSGFIYNLYGFGFIQEMKLLREAGFSPLEVIHAATQQGARALSLEDEIGTIPVGRKADQHRRDPAQ